MAKQMYYQSLNENNRDALAGEYSVAETNVNLKYKQKTNKYFFWEKQLSLDHSNS